MSYRLAIWLLFALFLITQTAFLSRVPTLMGDEASEGENVYELLHSDHLVVTGERSYIGPAIDYVRVPFVWLFGYTALAVRVPMLLFSAATFWLAAYSLRHLIGRPAAVMAVALMFFSPVYIAHQRLGWAISLFAFFAFLILALVIRNGRQAPLLAGLSAGLGLANHIIFLPTLAGLAAAWLARGAFAWRRLLAYWPALVGFWAGFGMQAAVLVLMKGDQGNPAANAALWWQRFHDLPSAWPLLVSGSAYVAHYTGVEFSPPVKWVVTAVICALALASWLGVKRRPAIALSWLWAAVYWPVLLYMIDRFSLRYFVAGMLWVWMMAGVGLYELLRMLLSRLIKNSKVAGPVRLSAPWRRFSSGFPIFQFFTSGGSLPEFAAPGAPRQPATRSANVFYQSVALVLGLILSVWMWKVLFVSYLQTGGSTGNFSLGNRQDSASALVDIQPLIECLANRGPVFSENIHIQNRLEYLSYSDQRLHVVNEEHKNQAQLAVFYRLPADEGKLRQGETCPQLAHFRVLPNF